MHSDREMEREDRDRERRRSPSPRRRERSRSRERERRSPPRSGLDYHRRRDYQDERLDGGGGSARRRQFEGQSGKGRLRQLNKGKKEKNGTRRGSDSESLDEKPRRGFKVDFDKLKEKYREIKDPATLANSDNISDLKASNKEVIDLDEVAEKPKEASSRKGEERTKRKRSRSPSSESSDSDKKRKRKKHKSKDKHSSKKQKKHKKHKHHKKTKKHSESSSSESEVSSESSSESESARGQIEERLSKERSKSRERSDKSDKEGAEEDDEGDFGPKPLSEILASGSSKYGKGMLKGEGAAMAAFIQSGERIPRRGEIGLSSNEISSYEKSGFVMSGSRSKRMNAVRMRKENQVYSIEEKKLMLKMAMEERQKREEAVLAGLLQMVNEKERLQQLYGKK